MDALTRWYRDELQGLKAVFAADFAKVLDFLEARDLAKWLRDEAAQDVTRWRRKARNAQRRANRRRERFEREGWDPDPDCFYVRSARRAAARAEGVAAVRDELTEALRYLDADMRAEARLAAALRREQGIR